MASARPRSSSLPTRRRRPATWREYEIDHSEPQACASAASEWPQTRAQAAPLADAPAPTLPGGKLSSQADLADRLYVSIATLARARKKGLLSGYRVGGQWRYSEQQIADYLNRTEQPLRLYGGPLSNDSHQS
jgi:hypothetical protein